MSSDRSVDEVQSEDVVRVAEPRFSGPAFLVRFLLVHGALLATPFGAWLATAFGEGAPGAGVTLLLGLLAFALAAWPLPGTGMRDGVPAGVRSLRGCFPARSGRVQLHADRLRFEASVFVLWPLRTWWITVPFASIVVGSAVLVVLSEVPLGALVLVVGVEILLTLLMLHANVGTHRLVVPFGAIQRARRDGAHLKLMVRVAVAGGGHDEDEIYIESSVARVVFLLERLDAAGVEVEPGKPFGS